MKKVLSTVAIALFALTVVFTSCRNDASTQGAAEETTTQPAELEGTPETQTSEAAPSTEAVQETADTTQAE